MEQIAIRELDQHTSRVLARVRAGETVEVSPSRPASQAPSRRPASSAPADPAELQSSGAQPAGGDYSSAPALSDSAPGAAVPGWVYLAGVLLLLAGAGILVTVLVLHRRGDPPLDDDTAEYPLR